MLDLWKKIYDKPRQHIEKQRRYLANKFLSSQSYSFSGSHVWMWKFDNEKAEQQRIDAFELWCWRRLLRVPWTARRSNQSIVKEISPECSLEGLMLKTKPQYFGHMIQRTDSLEKALLLGKIEGRRSKGQWRMEMVGWHHWLDGLEFDQAPGTGDGQGSLVCCHPWGHKESDTTEQLNWTDYQNIIVHIVCLKLQLFSWASSGQIYTA